MAPTTLLNMKTTTTPEGRDARMHGFPLHISDLLGMLPGASYIERVALSSPKGIRQTKRAIRNAFESQMNDEGFSLIEVLSPCPTNWRKSPADSWKWIDEALAVEFPPGVIIDRRVHKAKHASKKETEDAD